MNLLLIYAHPNPKSYTASVKENILKNINSIHIVELIDLYAEKFNPILIVNETQRRRDLIHDKEMERYRNSVQNADHIIFVYPVWWGGFPAILKGFIERVLVSGFAYSFKEGKETNIFPKGLMKGKSVSFFCTMDSPWIVSLVDPGWLSMKFAIFKYCGFSKIQRYVLSGLKRKSLSEREAWLKKVSKVAASF
ncbi:MAG: NAD(P)H-dependent oxidoreductase [Leptospiraceae bacterium]|nr:NAD(P)H-dependent oxidoreductase [Leptospiraceae bacterium]